MAITYIAKYDGAGDFTNYEQYAQTGSLSITTPANAAIVMFVTTLAYDNGNGATLTHSVSGGGLTWGQYGPYAIAGNFLGGYQRMSMWYANSPSAQTFTATVTKTGNTGPESFATWAQVYTGVSGPGAAVTRGANSGTVTATLTTTTAGSAVAVGAFLGRNVTTARSWVTSDAGSFSEVTYYVRNNMWTSGYHNNAGAVGSKTIGFTNPTQTNTGGASNGLAIAGLELLEGGGTPPPDPAGPEPGRFFLSP